MREILLPREVEGADWERMKRYFGRGPIFQQSQPVISEALDQGARRAAGTFDVFVHPEFPFQTYWEKRLGGIHGRDAQPRIRMLRKSQEKFRESVSELLRSADPVIVIGSVPHDASPLKELYTEEQELCSFRSGHYATGRLPLGEFKRLAQMMRGFRPDDRIRIHGADFGACPTQFALQWYAASTLGQFHPQLDHSAFDDLPTERSRRRASMEGILPTELRLTGALRQETGLRLGHVFDCHQEAEGIVSDATDPTTQMIDGETKIYS